MSPPKAGEEDRLDRPVDVLEACCPPRSGERGGRQRRGPLFTNPTPAVKHPSKGRSFQTPADDSGAAGLQPVTPPYR